jgi:hypothetical protein
MAQMRWWAGYETYPQSPVFIGRKDLLTALHTTLQDQEHSTAVVQALQ